MPQTTQQGRAGTPGLQAPLYALLLRHQKAPSQPQPQPNPTGELKSPADSSPPDALGSAAPTEHRHSALEP